MRPGASVKKTASAPKHIPTSTALRLSRFFGGDAQSWLNLQTAYDLRTAELNAELQASVRQVHPMQLHTA